MRRIVKPFFASLVALLLLAGCGTQQAANTSQPDSSNASTQAPASEAPKEGDKPGAGEVLARVKQSGILRVGFEGTYSPFNFLNDQNQFDGFDVDISNDLAKRLGVKTEFIATKWDGLIGGLNSDKFDIIIAQMSITEERKKSVDFTDPYVITGGVLATRTETEGITKLEDLKGKKVGVGAGTTFDEVVSKVEGAQIQRYKAMNDYVQDLANKRLDAIMNDQLVLGYNIKEKNLPIKIVSDIINEDQIGMEIKKGNPDFVEAVNKALADMKQDGTYETIYRKWFGVSPKL
ncbi:ABC transporter substrate-binding protein [Brevibacillus sp. B_LB10_24]|uniref:ABC transporter substrate-binding protein n=1 Tax=Brevibacillus sp. B_LB10_24 TaxID=3380645 RepID=UPI0038B7C710